MAKGTLLSALRMQALPSFYAKVVDLALLLVEEQSRGSGSADKEGGALGARRSSSKSAGDAPAGAGGSNAAGGAGNAAGGQLSPKHAGKIEKEKAAAAAPAKKK